MAETKKIIRQALANLSSLALQQIGVMQANDADLGYKMWGGKDAAGSLTYWLAKDKPGRLTTLTLTDPTIATGTAGILGHSATGVISGGAGLNALADVTIVTPLDDQILKYNSTSSQWENVTEGAITAADVTIDKIGSALYDTAQAYIRFNGSAGTVEDGSITDAGGATIDVAAGSGFIRSTDACDGVLYAFNWLASTGIAIPTDTVRYVGVEYNSGAPQVVVKTSDSWDGHTEFRLGSVVNEGGTLHILNNAQVACDSPFHSYHRFYETRPFERADRLGGIIPGETGTRNLTLSAGEFYDGNSEFVIDAVDTSGADTCHRYYVTAGTWTLQTSVTQWDNTQYNNTTTGLAAMNSNWYANIWLWVDPESNGKLIMLYPQAQFANLASAEDETPPTTLPLRLQKHGVFIGRIIFQKSAATAEEIESIYETTFGSTAVTNHNSLAGLQGGAAGEYYHLTAGEYTGLSGITTGSVLFADGSGNIGQDNANLFWDDSNNRLGIGTASPSQALDLIGSLELEATVSSTTGVIYKGANRFIHDYDPPDNGTVNPTGDNLFVGVNAGNFTMGSTATSAGEASLNLGIGYESLKALTTGSSNVVVGYSAGKSITTGGSNSILGKNAGEFLTSGESNVCVGSESGRVDSAGTIDTTSIRSVLIGRDARVQTTGQLNEIVIGYQGRGIGSNTATIGNSSITQTRLGGIISTINGGLSTGWIANSLSMGHDSSGHTSWIQSGAASGTSLALNPQGGNVGIGVAAPSQALDLIGSLELEATVSSTTGVIYKGANRFIHDYDPPDNGTVNPDGNNTFIGVSSGNFTMGATATNTYEASGNVGVGVNALDALTTGYFNTGAGMHSLTAVTSGFFNTVLGYYSGAGLTTGSGNVFIGVSAGRFFTGGGANINSTGTNQICIGKDTYAAANGDTNEIVIGYQGLGIGSNTAIIGNSSITQTRLGGIISTINGGLSTGWIANSLSMGHDSSGHTSWIQSGAVAGTILYLNPQGAPVTIGAAASTHSLTGTGDLIVSGSVEVDGTLYPDGNVNIGDNNQIVLGTSTDTFLDWSTAQTNESLVWGLGNTSRSILFCERADRETNFGAPNYIDPTIRIQSSDATTVAQYVATQHNQTDAKEIIGTGSKVTEHITPVELADDASFSLPTASEGIGELRVIGAETYARFSWEADGTVTISDSSIDVTNADTDTFFCLFDGGSSVTVRNRLGAAKKVMFEYRYYTP